MLTLRIDKETTQQNISWSNNDVCFSQHCCSVYCFSDQSESSYSQLSTLKSASIWARIEIKLHILRFQNQHDDILELQMLHNHVRWLTITPAYILTQNTKTRLNRNLFDNYIMTVHWIECNQISWWKKSWNLAFIIIWNKILYQVSFCYEFKILYNAHNV